MTNKDVGGFRPETRVLDARIQATIARAQQDPETMHSDTMLFTGNRHQSFPTLVVQDPVLEPVDKLVWMVIMLHARETGDSTAFPSYASIAQKTNVASTSTIARAIAILRATRWLTLCARLREANGRFRGNVYALHDEPLPLVDALHLDSDYMPFLRQLLEHHHARVRRVAKGVLETIDEDIQQGLDICDPDHPLERRMQAVHAIQQASSRRYFAFSANVMTRLRNAVSDERLDHHDQNSKTGDDGNQILNPQNSKSVSCSSYINKTTTTTTTEALKIYNRMEQPPLVYPTRLSANQHDLANRYLKTVPADMRQAILDELEGRLRSEEKGMRPVYDELRFLHGLCQAANAGEFVPNLGIKVRDALIESEQERSSCQQHEQTEANPKRCERSIASAQKHLTELRKSLNLPTRTTADESLR